MTEVEQEDISAVFNDVLKTVDDEIEVLATSGGITAGFVVAPKLRVVKDKQATLVATGNADPQTAKLYRETIVSPEEDAIERWKQLRSRYFDTNASAVKTADAFRDIARKSQKRAMDETGDVDPKTVC